MSDAIRVGLVGFGYASKTFHAPLIGGTPGMALKAVASSDADKVHADWPGVKVMSAPGDLLDDPDIDLVVIATPNDTTFRWRKRRWRRESMLWWISPLP
ncbi:L-arabinose 1-dehydrogenase [Klebsiella pneumoniae]|nr:L-arabinose 1-dehydrogenase [Klebsiella pneumoniae]